MRNVLITLGVIGLLVFLVFQWAVGINNNIIEKEGITLGQWANVESSYQRRSDLIPNLVATVKGYAAHEQETLEGVIKARSEATKTTIDPTNITEDQMAKFQQAQQGLSGALSRLLVTVERYPDLKANQNFLELQSQLEGTENRINVERNRYNELAAAYKIYVSKFPTNIVANFINKKELPLYKAVEGSDVAPTVAF